MTEQHFDPFRVIKVRLRVLAQLEDTPGRTGETDLKHDQVDFGSVNLRLARKLVYRPLDNGLIFILDAVYSLVCRSVNV